VVVVVVVVVVVRVVRVVVVRVVVVVVVSLIDQSSYWVLLLPGAGAPYVFVVIMVVLPLTTTMDAL